MVYHSGVLAYWEHGARRGGNLWVGLRIAESCIGYYIKY